MPQLLNIMHEAYNRPVLLEPGYAGFFYAYLSRRTGADRLRVAGELLDRDAMQQKAASYGSSRNADRERDYNLVQGVAIIPVSGTLVNRCSWIDSYSGITSYGGLRQLISDADNDPEVKGIFLELDTPGGAVSGCFDFCDWLPTITKPTAGFANEQAASAGYAIASQLGKLYIPRTGAMGSVGVLLAHRDYSKQMEMDGVTVTLIHAGAHKVDGNPYEPLPDSVREEWQAEMDATRLLFAQTVARGRGLTADAVLATEARMYTGQAAVDVGFADAVMSRDDAFNDFLQTLSSTGSFTFSGANMSQQNPTPTARAQDDTYTSAQVTAMIAEAVDGEHNRIFGIIENPEAEGRMPTAIKLAKAGLEAGEASTILATIPRAEFSAAVMQSEDANALALKMMAQATVVPADKDPTTPAAVTAQPTRKLIV